MATTYNLAPFPVWQIIYPNSANPNLVGLPIPAARVFTYKSTAHNTPKTTFSSNVGDPPPAHTNPVVADTLGQVTIYWALNDQDPTDLYFVEIMGPEGDDTVYYSFDNFDGSAVVPAENINTNIDINYIRNPQFSIWEHIPVEYTGGTSLNAKKFSTTNAELVCDDWWFFKDSTTATDTISRQPFDSGQTDVPANPSFYIRYDCTVAGSTETQKYFLQYFKGVQFLNGQAISLSFRMRANSSSRTVTIKWHQNFGTGGLPASTIVTQLGNPINLTAAWAEYKIENFTIPSIQGNLIGTNRDDYCFLSINLDNNQISTYDLCNVQLERGNNVSVFQQDTYESYRQKLSKYFQIQTSLNQFIIKTIDPTNLHTFILSEDAGWIPMNDLTIANPTVAGGAGTIRNFAAFKLYCVLWNTCNDTDCPVLPGGRGADAVADWNADKTINFPLSMCRAIGNYGSGSGLTGRAAGKTDGAESITLNTNQLPIHQHTFQTDRKVVTITGNFSSRTVTNGPDLPNVVDHTGVLQEITATDNAGLGQQVTIINPIVYLPFYIHL